MKTPDPHIYFKDGDVTLFIRREDLLHPTVPGNKFRKLKYNLIEAKRLGHDTLLTFGGAFSNHIAAVAALGREKGLKTIGIIRGEEVVENLVDNPTLALAQDNGMNLNFISREEFRRKADPEFIESLRKRFGSFYLMPEGGTNLLAVKGCEEILTYPDMEFSHICVSVGTGGTIAGLVNSSAKGQTVLGFPALKSAGLEKEIENYTARSNWKIVRGYEVGGYAKVSVELIDFMNRFNREYGVPSDPVYTGKLFFGVMDMIAGGYFEKGSKILAIHTGGLQGIEGMNKRLKNKNLPQIEIYD